MEQDGFSEELRDLLAEFEGALRDHLKTSEEFQHLMAYLAKRNGGISLYVAAQIMTGEGGRSKGVNKTVPVRFEITRNDVQFLRSLKIKPEI